MKRPLPIIIGVIAVGVAVFFALNRTRIEETRRAIERTTLPEAVSVEEAVEDADAAGLGTRDSGPVASQETTRIPNPESQIPTSLNLAVPFTVQAPFGVWDELHKDACEEASVMMADAFYTKRTFTPESAEREILALADWETKRFGYWKDTTAEETAVILREYYGFSRVDVRTDVTAEAAKREIARGNVIIVPVYGRGLNPFFTPPGPDYHMLVIKGYTATKLITNDPGTRRGADFTYDYDKLLGAVHDWNGGDVLHGRKVMIVVHPK